MCCVQDNSSKFISNMQQLQDSVAKYVAAIDQQVMPCASSNSSTKHLITNHLMAVGCAIGLATRHKLCCGFADLCRWSAWKWRT